MTQENFYINCVQRGNTIMVREWDVNQDREVRRKVKFKPVLFTKAKNPETAKYHGIHGEPLEPKKFECIRDARDFCERYEGANGFKVYGNDDYVSQFISREYPGEVKFDQSKIRIFNLDIEVHSAVQMYGEDQQMKLKIGEKEKMVSRQGLRDNMQKLSGKGVQIMTHQGWEELDYFRFTADDAFPHPNVAKWPITLIGLRDSFTGKYNIWGFGNLDWDPINPVKSYCKTKHWENIKKDPQHDLTPDDIIYHDCDDEEDLCRKFLKYWSENTPAIYTGWNTEGFDTPYMCNRIEQILGEESVKLLSPWGVVNKRQKEDDYGNMRDVFNILGVAQMDYLELYKKYTYKEQELYKLDHIAHVELGDGKLSYEEAGSLRTLFRMNYQKYTEYNAVDILCVERIERKKKFIDVVLTVAYYAKINYEDTSSPVRTWDVIITNYLMNTRNVVVPAMKISDKPRKYAGAFVKEPQKGKHGWLCSIDLDSLYPHLIMQWNIGPETLIPDERLPSALADLAGSIEKYDFDEWGNPVIDGAQGRDAYICRFANFKPDLSPLKKYPVGMAANLAFFDNRRQSFLSELMEFNYSGRKFDKRQMLAYKQELIWWQAYAENPDYSVDDELMVKNRKIGKLRDDLLFRNNSGLSSDEAKAMSKKCKDEAARLDCMQMAKKILLNSAYGAIGNRYFRFFNLKLAEAITLSGQVAIQFIAQRMSDEINRICKNPKLADGSYEKDYIIAIDTDSNYVNMDDVVKKYKPEQHAAALAGDVAAKDEIVDFLDNVFNKHLQKFMDDSYAQLKDYMNCKQQKMNMSREMIAQSGFWTKKKKYCLKCWDDEGARQEEAYWKVMGLSAISSTTPEVCRGWLKQMYKVILDKGETEFQEQIAEYKKEFMTLPIHMIAKNSSCNGINKYTDKETIFHADASWQARCGILYNHRVKQLKLDREVETILDGDKVKLIELKMPNPLSYGKVAFPSFLDPKLGLDKYVDREAAFQKNFVKPLERFYEILKWSPIQVATLDDFFM